jgi:hypothetical protein
MTIELGLLGVGWAPNHNHKKLPKTYNQLKRRAGKRKKKNETKSISGLLWLLASLDLCETWKVHIHTPARPIHKYVGLDIGKYIYI